jgi:hypothetical protein
MKKTWTRIVVVAVWPPPWRSGYFDKQRLQQDPEQQLDTTLNAMPAWQVIERAGARAASAHPRPDPPCRKRASLNSTSSTPSSRRSSSCRCRACKTPRTPTWWTMKANMEQTAAIQKVSDDACFRFLYPA